MKNKIVKRSRLGFTLAELLLVFAILAILVTLGVTGFVALRQNIVITKFDDMAREIYVAAQNQLARLDANGTDKAAADALKAVDLIPSKPSDYTPNDWEVVNKSYYFATQDKTATMEVLLPLGTMADDVRSTGFYVIEYNADTRMVYSVFYSEGSFDYKTVSEAPNFRSSKDVRKEYMVGYYGGSAVLLDPLTHCETPRLEIINENELRLNILNVPGDVTLSVIISDGNKTVTVPADMIESASSDVRTVLLDSLVDGKHFCELFPDLTPGNDLNITVTYEKEKAISSSASISANSLFATRESNDTGDIVTLAWARHLQNLETTVSGLKDDKIAIARQTEHIQWVENRAFVSISNDGQNEKLLRFEGGGLEIRDLKGSNGLFAKTKENMALSGVRVVNPVITAADGSTEPVGALVGTAASGTEIHMCGVYSRKVKDEDKSVDYAAYKDCYVDGKTATTGGLVGEATNTKVTFSFAALPSLKGQNGASLIGSASNCNISDSYANCDDLEPGFNYFVSPGAEANTVSHCYAVGNVESETAYDFSGTGDTVTDSYYAVSHRQFAENGTDNVDLEATEFYCKGETGDWQSVNQEQLQDAAKEPEWTGKGWDTMIAPLSHPYRESLDSMAYPYPAIGELDHYGSWPVSDGTVVLTVNMALLNRDGYAIFAGEVVVTDKNSGEVLFNSAEHKKPDGTFDGVNTVQVKPGTEISIAVKAAEGYSYFHTTIEGTTHDKEDLPIEYNVRKNTEVIVTFQQNKFILKGLPAVSSSGGDLGDSTYSIDLTNPKKTLDIAATEQHESVETDSAVTVRPNVPVGHISSVVWYTPEGKNAEADRVYLTQRADGSYTFDMPAENTDIHVMYTTEESIFNIEYYLMDTDGLYPNEPTQETTYKCGLGSQINQAMINALAESSWLTATIENERVLYLAEGIVTKSADEVVFHSTVDEDGKVTLIDGPYTTVKDEDPYNIKIYIARKQYDITLIADEHISGVHFGEADASVPEVTRSFYYGDEVTARADVVPGYSFTYWDPQDTRFMMSAEPEYTFKVPHFDMEMKATAKTNQYLVTVNLLENDESWLYSDASRQADPITLTLVNSQDPTKTFPLKVLTEDTISYAMQAVIPAVLEYEVGYYVRVDYDSGLTSWVYTSGSGTTDESNTKLLLYVRDREVVTTAKFYSVTYYPNRQNYIGSAPKGGTFPEYYHLTVEGNSGLLRSDPVEEAIFSGWHDFYAEGTGTDTVYGGGEILMLTQRTDLFAQWNSSNLKVIYHAGEATGGELPLDLNQYLQNATVTIKWGSLTRNGYRFIGWTKTEGSTEPDFTEDNLTHKLTTASLNLYPVWELEDYNVWFYDFDGTLLTGSDYQFGVQHYGNKITAPDYEVAGKAFIGWSATKGGDVAYRDGEEITITGTTNLYARFATETVEIVYKSTDGSQEYKRELFGKGISSYLNGGPSAGLVTAWSTEANGKGELYPCDENGRSESAYAFTDNVTLYAVTGKVYNFNERLWFETLYDAVKSPDTQDSHTLIVYRDTEEPHNILFNKSLYVMSHGNRTVKWIDGATVDGSDRPLDDRNIVGQYDGSDEFTGCMKVYKDGAPVNVVFGRSDVSNLSMKDSTLTFDANKQSRVIALANKATFQMYDGITLTNGDRSRPESHGNPNESSVSATDNSKHYGNARSYYGGGVYAGLESTFYMYGGTISYCSAYKGGGVYLFANKGVPTPGSRMIMGDMVKPTAYSSTAIYYIKGDDDFYVNAPDNVTPTNYKQYYVTAGNPQICYNTATKVYNSTGDVWSFNDGGGGILMLDLKDGDLVLYKGRIHNNTAKANGGGLISDAGDTKDENGKVTKYGNDSKLRIYEVDISHNTADGYGGGIFQWQGIVYVYNSTLRQNTAKSGGGIYLHHWDSGGKEYDKSELEFHYGDIADNSAREKGGGIYVEVRQVVKIPHGNVTRNSAGVDGGGIYVETSYSYNGTLLLEGGTVTHNTAAYNGGGIYSAGVIDLSGGILSDNNAGHYGGAIWSNGTVNITGGTVCNNDARYLGGGIYVEQNGNLILSDGKLYGNTDTDNENDWNGYLEDEDNEHPGRNDVYLTKDRKITIPAGGINLSGEERVAVDCDNDASLRFEDKGLPRQIVEYENAADFMPDHVYYFTYFGTRSTEYSIGNRHKPNLTVKTHTQLEPPREQAGLYLDEQSTDANSSYVIFNLNYEDCRSYEPILTTVGTELNINEQGIDTNREGYYLAGWARTPHAIEEEYALYYDVVENKWKSNYESGEGWKNSADEPVYTVENLYSQTLYAMWRPCVVVYDVTQEAADAGVTVRPTSAGPSVTLLTPSLLEYTKDGETLHFKHWENAEDTADTTEYKPMQQLELTENLRLRAVWEVREADKVVFTFHFNSGTSDQTGEMRREVEVLKDSQYRFDVEIRQANKILVGWNTRADGTGQEYPTNASITAAGNMDFYAVWANALTLTYEPNGGFGNSWVVTDREGAEVRISDKEPLRDGHVFIGWSREPDATTPEYTSGNPFELTEHTTLYAVWEVDETVHYSTVSYNLNGGTGAGFDTVLVSTGSDITVPEPPTRDGYVFMGWWDEAGTTYRAGETLHVTSNTTLTAIWGCYINIDPKDGVLDQPESTFLMTENTVFNLKNVNATRDGYILKGWSINERATKADYGPEGSFIVQNGLTLYAVWAETVTVTLNFNYAGAPADVVETVEKGTAYQIKQTPARDGFNFKGWATVATATTAVYWPNATLTADADMTLYGVWAQTVTITFKHNYEGAPEDIVKTVEKGSSYQIDVPDPARDGIIFMGWSTDDKATTADIKAGDTLTADANMTLYAVWEQKTWTVKFDLAGGSWDVQQLEYPVQDGGSLTIPNAPLPTKTYQKGKKNYNFKGWVVEPAGEKVEVSYGADGTITIIITNIRQDITLTAQWEKKN